MQFNGNKFELMRYGSNKILKESNSYFTPDYEEIIDERSSLSNLGIIMSNDDTFSILGEYVCSKVRQNIPVQTDLVP